ncbi:MAG: putative ABC transporter permease [Eubacterium sp.]|nr:putative ABC transporter permease [Eubacterium sp.]
MESITSTKKVKTKAKIIISSHAKVNETAKMNFYKIVFIYMLGGIVGTLWETFLNFFNGYGFIYCNGSIFTPFNFVYGCGAIIIIGCLHKQTEWWKVFFIGAIGGGAVEYILNFLEETLLGTRSWNYEGKLLNINGRTTIPYMAVWGMLCVAVIFIVYKPLSRLLERIPKNVMKTVATAMFIILAIDLLITVTAILRYSGRNSGQEAFTAIGAFIDKAFHDGFMAKRFPNLKFIS